MGKVFLLLAAARLMHDGELDPSHALTPEPQEWVDDSGVWQYFPEQPLTVEAMCTLVAATSDNIAANVLLREIGLPRVQQISYDLGMPDTLMIDRIRAARTEHDPPGPSRGRAVDLARLMDHLAASPTSGGDDGLVGTWLARNCDLSMVASAFDLDPLAHIHQGEEFWLFNKTGTDVGVRADAGAFGTGRMRCSYAVVANWTGDSAERRHDVMTAMRAIGLLIRDTVAPDFP